MKNSKITVIDESGKETEANVLLYFNIEKNSKDYVLYTFGEVDEQAMETIHASVLTKENENYKLEKIADEEWLEVKDIMREIIRNEDVAQTFAENNNVQNEAVLKATYVSDNPVKVTGDMKGKLIAFINRQIKINDFTNKINELNTVATGDDKKAAKKANKEVQTLTKNLEELKNEEQKVIANLSGVNFAQKENIQVEPTVEVQPEVQEMSKEEPAPVAEVNPENSLSDELSDFSFDMPTEEAKTVAETPAIDTPTDASVEAVENTPVVENTAIMPELPKVNIAEIEPTMEEENKEEVSETPEPVITEDPVTIPEPVTPDYNFEEPVVPASDEEIENALAEEEKAEEQKNEDNEDEIKVTPEDIAAIDSIINGETESVDDDYSIDKEVFKSSENTPELVKTEDAIFNQMSDSNSSQKLEEAVKYEPREYGLKDYATYATYEDWLYAFAEKNYGKNSFTREELKALVKKNDFVSESAFAEMKNNQVTDIIGERDNLEEEKASLIVELNASKTLSKNVTSELNELRKEYKTLQEEHNNVTSQLHDAEDNLKDTEEALKDARESLSKMQEELADARQEFQDKQDESAKQLTSLQEENKRLKANNEKIKDLIPQMFAALGNDPEEVVTEEGHSKSKGMAA